MRNTVVRCAVTDMAITTPGIASCGHMVDKERVILGELCPLDQREIKTIFTFAELNDNLAVAHSHFGRVNEVPQALKCIASGKLLTEYRVLTCGHLANISDVSEHRFCADKSIQAEAMTVSDFIQSCIAYNHTTKRVSPWSELARTTKRRR